MSREMTREPWFRAEGDTSLCLEIYFLNLGKFSKKIRLLIVRSSFFPPLTDFRQSSGRFMSNSAKLLSQKKLF